ncbi:MAG: glycosyl hydrolase [Methylococcales bacterium]|nr:glycosyl hydrolase [Methylococcales bacterium]
MYPNIFMLITVNSFLLFYKKRISCFNQKLVDFNISVEGRMGINISSKILSVFCVLSSFTLTTYAYAEVSRVLPSSSKVVWGAVGHNDRPTDNQYPYNAISLSRQVALLKEAGLRAYRSGCTEQTCSELVTILSRNGMIFLRSIELRPDDKLDEHANYGRGYHHAFNEASKYRGKIKFYEASNELDTWTKMLADGAEGIQYNPIRYHKARGFLKGLVDGIHKADPEAKVLVDNAGWCHYGFLNSLWEDGLRWDITAVHWYSDHGNIEKAGCRNANVAKIHASFGKPIWITEFNKKSSVTEDDQEAAAVWISDFMNQINRIAPKYNIQAAFVYELFDEPTLTGGEQFYGILNHNGKPKAFLHSLKHVLKSLEPGPS